MSTDNTDIRLSNTRTSGGFGKAIERGTAGVFEGAQTGAIIGAGMTGAAFIGDMLIGAPLLTELLFHGASPVMGALGLTAVHSAGAAAFEGVTEAYDGYRGIEEERDHIRDTAASLDHKLAELEQGRGPAQQKNYSFDGPAPQSSQHVQDILAQGPGAAQQASWQDRVAAQQLLQNAQDRTV